MTDTSTLLGKANKALANPELQQLMATVGISLDPEGPGGYIGRQALRQVSSRQAGIATSKALADTLTPPGQPGPTSVERNKDGSTTITGDYSPNNVVPRAQQVPDNATLGMGKPRTMSPSTRRKIISRAKRLGISPVTALNLVAYDYDNVNEPHLSRYDPESNLDYFAELLNQQGGDENKALVAYRNSPGSEPDPNYLGNVTAYTPYSKRAVDEDGSAVQPDVSQMIVSKEGPMAPQVDVRDEVATTLGPYARQPVGEVVAARATRGLTAEDFAGLTPSEINQIGNLYMRGREVEAETLLGIRRLEHDIAKTIGDTRRSFSKAKIDAAKGISSSGLSKSDRQSLLDALKAASTLEEVEQIEIATANAPAPASAGVERDAISHELYGKRYYDLTQAEQKLVNEEASVTGSVVTTNDGVFIVNKRTRRAVQINPSTQTPRAEAVPMSQPTTTEPAVNKPRRMTTEEFSQSVSGTTGDRPFGAKPPTESEAKARLYGSRANQANVIMENLEKDPSNRAKLGTFSNYIKNKLTSGAGIKGSNIIAQVGQLGVAIADPLMRLARTPEERQYLQAKLNFTAAVLRKESGAAITASEYADADELYTPQLGDDAKTIEQKMLTRRQVIQLFRDEANAPLLTPDIEQLPTATKRELTRNSLTEALAPHSTKSIIDGNADSVVRALMDMDETGMNTLMSKSGIKPGIQAAVRRRIKILQMK